MLNINFVVPSSTDAFMPAYSTNNDSDFAALEELLGSDSFLGLSNSSEAGTD